MRYARLVLAASAIVALGCGDDEIVIPGDGDIFVTTATTGVDVDTDGYWVRLNGGADLGMGVNDTLIFPDVEEGTHSVTLSGMAPNCAAVGSNPQQVTVTSGAVERVSFDVNCVQAGQLAVTTSTSGDSIDFEYTVTLPGSGSRLAAANGTVSFETLMPGDYTVRLEGVSVNCTVGGENPRTVNVTGGAVAETTFSVVCTPALLDRIIFASERDGNSEIYSMTDRGTDLFRITNDPANDQAPIISPDGTRIAFESDRDGDFEVYVVNIDGSGIVQVTDNVVYDGEPTWSPDGQQIAYVSERDGNAEIYIMNDDGTGDANLTNHASEDLSPAWSPDGEMIAFSSDRLTSAEIYVMETDGSGTRVLTANLAADVSPAWSPDGATIAFATDRDGNWDVYTIDVATENEVRVTSDPGTDIAPAWSPDGTRVAIATDRDGDLEIYYHSVVIPLIVKLTDDGAVDTAPCWSPER
jgi:dipeptidyl aminopeptidase/acylaminoacyl peptidase